MMKYLLCFLSLILSTVVVQSQDLLLTTVSENPAWSPRSVVKSGLPLTWTATGSGLDTSPITVVANIPTFDFSSNDGSTIQITISSDDGFDGLTVLDFYNSFDGGLIQSVDFQNATELTNLNLRYQELSSLDISLNTQLTSLTVRGNQQLSSGVLDISNNTQLTFIQADVTQLTSIDLANNTQLTDVRLYSADLTTNVLDQILIDLDGHGLLDGDIQIRNNVGSLSSASLTAYNSLISKGWAIDVDAPEVDTEPPVIGTLNPASNIANTSLTLTWTEATDNIGVTGYNVFQDGSLIATLGNVLTYDVTGLTENTTYNFYITAFDNEGNESSNSNTIQATTSQSPTGTTFTFTTVSTSGSWSPQRVTNSGAVLTWTAAPNGVFGGQEVVADDPTFDFSSNDGTPINVTVTSPDGFSGLTRLDFWNNDGLGSQITELDVTNAIFLTLLNTRYNQLSSLDVTQNTQLTSLTVRGNQQLSSGVLDISNNTQLTFIQADATQISTIDLSNNTQLTDVRLYNADLTTNVLDQILIDLDGHGLLDGDIQIRNNVGSLSSASLTAYNSLISKGWAIDVDAPEVDTEPPVIGTLNPASNIANTSLTLTWTEATDNIGVTGYNVFQDGSLIASLGNVLTYDVTGLTESTTYNFYITAFDNEGNESSNSNTIQATTLQSPTGTTFTFTTVSTSGSWSPQRVTNSGAVLTWTAAPNGVFGGQEVVADDPTFDFSSNDGTPINVTVTSPDGFSGLTRLDFWNNDGLGSQITELDVTNAIFLTLLNTRYNQLSSLDVTQNTQLTSLTVRGNQQLSSGVLDISNNTQLTFIQADATQISTIDLSNNTQLTDVRLYNADLTTNVLDQILIDLDGHGLLDGDIQIRNNEGNLSILSLTAYNSLITKGWSIDVDAPEPAPGPQINIVRSDLSVPIQNGNTPDVADGTDFGQVGLGSPVTETFEIQNLGDSDLIINFFFTGGTDFSFNPPGGGGITLGTGESTEIDVTFDPSALTNRTGSITINSNTSEIADQTFVVNLAGEGIEATTPEIITVLGNGISIPNGASIPQVANGTDFEDVEVGQTGTSIFTIQNDGTANLTISSIGFTPVGSDPEFSIGTISELLPFDLAPGGQMTFEVVFAPTGFLDFDAVVSINSSDSEENPFQYVVAGTGIEPVITGDIMISQYYHGFSGNDNWIEVSNISDAVIPAGTYFLALFDESLARQGVIEVSVPTESESIPELAVGETILFRNGAASLPDASNIGNAAQIVSDVCSFTGDDVILISTTNDATAYNLRVEIMGNISPNPSTSPQPWGFNDSYIKGGCSTEMAHTDFDLSDWSFVVLEDVNNANPATNLALGTQVVGPTEFDGFTWSNLLPDQSRTAVISGSFTGAPNNFIACNLTINAGVDAVFDSNGTTSNSIVIYGDLIIDGNLTIGDQESLVIYNPVASLGSITKLENSTPHNFPNDVTYWSSPVEGSQLSTVFAGTDPERWFDFRAGQENPRYEGTNFKYWWNSSGAMGIAKGYAIQGNGTGVQSIVFEGVPNNGPVNLNLFYSGTPDIGPTANENFNMIGNPYPAAIDIQRVLLDNGTVNEIALWTHSTEVDPGTGEFFDSDYVYYNTTGSTTPGVTENIGSGQGFMIRTTANGGTSITDDYKLIGRNDQFFKGVSTKTSKQEIANENKVWLRLNIGREKSDILVAFMEDATDGYDVNYDVIGNLYDSKISLVDKNLKFYSKIDNNKFVIQGMGPYNSGRKVPLGFDTKKQGDVRISLTKTMGELEAANIYLIDHALNVRHDLKKSDYVFYQTELGEFSNRFTLEFDGGTGDFDEIDVVDGDRFSISNDFDIMNVESGKVVKDIKVYDMLGRMVIHKAPNLNSFQLNTSTVRTGTIMIIEATMEDGSLINTKSIKY